ncbi:MAG TPA: redoxin domain-containing protein [Gemmatimonadaceae bacterium]|jgi:peroxiredoxin|nr:redoxin domain-containing protein [Gemmatimonadaceae bacterium]
MEAYRDQYAKLFNQGRGVVVLAVSVDPDTMLAAWARELETPLLFGSDSGQVVGKRYGAIRGTIDNRSLFVIDPSGRIAHRMLPFNELSQAAYEELAEAVKKTLPSR